MTSSSRPLQYPSLRRDETVVETHFGQAIKDPYRSTLIPFSGLHALFLFRWLENPESAETKAFVEAENEITFKFLKTFEHRESFREKSVLTSICRDEIPYGLVD